jgi:hypothetical protein
LKHVAALVAAEDQGEVLELKMERITDEMIEELIAMYERRVERAKVHIAALTELQERRNNEHIPIEGILGEKEQS